MGRIIIRRMQAGLQLQVNSVDFKLVKLLVRL